MSKITLKEAEQVLNTFPTELEYIIHNFKNYGEQEYLLNNTIELSNYYKLCTIKVIKEINKDIGIKLLEIQQDIRDLRDSDNHICPCHENVDDPDGICTCSNYDAVIDKIEKIL